MAGKNESDVLKGWKEIAAYLGVHEATAKRWENECALPVKRPGGRAIMATRAKLDAWINDTVSS